MTLTRKVLAASAALATALSLTAVPASAQSSVRSAQTIKVAVASWGHAVGDAEISAFVREVTNISIDAGNDDITSLATDCQVFGTTITSAQKHPIPDTAVQVHWSQALEDGQLFVSYCVVGADQLNDADLQQAVSYEGEMNTQLVIVAKMLNAVGVPA